MSSHFTLLIQQKMCNEQKNALTWLLDRLRVAAVIVLIIHLLRGWVNCVERFVFAKNTVLPALFLQYII